MLECKFCKNVSFYIDKITTYCNKCDIVFIKEHYPYSLYYDFDLFNADKFEDYISRY